MFQNAFWTYCRNFEYGKKPELRNKNEQLKGIILAGGLYEGYVRVPWNGKSEPLISVPISECLICKRTTDQGISIEHEGKTLGFCTNKHYVEWWSRFNQSDVFIPENYEAPSCFSHLRKKPEQDHYNLQRFLSEQEHSYEQVIAELKKGKKFGHWMWYIFPQIFGLGQSSMARKYAIFSLEEAKAYLSHEILGKRLIKCSILTLKIEKKSAFQVFGDPDFLKFRSCLTLFDYVGSHSVFNENLKRFYGGEPDDLTLKLIDDLINSVAGSPKSFK